MIVRSRAPYFDRPIEKEEENDNDNDSKEKKCSDDNNYIANRTRGEGVFLIFEIYLSFIFRPVRRDQNKPSSIISSQALLTKEPLPPPLPLCCE